MERFSFSSGFEEGRDRCPYDPAKGYTSLLVGKNLYLLLGVHYFALTKQ